MIMTVFPPNVFCPHTVSLEQVYHAQVEVASVNPNCLNMSNLQRLFVCAIANSYVVDAYLRRSITTHLSFFFVYNCPCRA